MNSLKIGTSLSLLGILLGGCNANLDTRKLVAPTTPPLTPIQQSGTAAVKPSPSPSITPSGHPSASPAPSPTGSPVCPQATASFEQVSAGMLVQWVENAQSETASSSLSASAITGLRLTQNEGLYLTVIDDSAGDAAIGFFHCDSNSPSSPKIMGFSWMTAGSLVTGGGNDPSVSDEASLATGCPDVSSNTLTLAATKNLPAGTTAAQVEVVRVRSTASESLYLATVLGSAQQLYTSVLHCDEKTPAGIDVLGSVSSQH